MTSMIFSRASRPYPRPFFTFLVLLCAMMVWIDHACAGRPMTIDDAGLTNPKGCEFDSWVQNSRADTEYWLMPACNFTGNLEWSLGGAHAVNDGRTRTIGAMQAKTALRPLETNGWGVAVEVGNQFDADRSISGDWSINVPVSFSFHDDALLLHVNTGWLREKENRREVWTWGVGSEWQATPTLAWTSEIYRQDSGNAFIQFGMRYALVRDRVLIDCSYGDRLGSDRTRDGRLITLGIEWVVDNIFP